MSDPFAFMGCRGSSRPDAHEEKDTSKLPMEFKHDIHPEHVRGLWAMLDKLNDAADASVRSSVGGADRELDESEVEYVVDEHGFEPLIIDRGDSSGGRVWELTVGGEHLAFLLESDIYSERFVLFPRADGVRCR